MDQHTVIVLAVVAASIIAFKATQAVIRAGPLRVLARAFLLIAIWAWAVPLVPLTGLALTELPALLLVPAAFLFLVCRTPIGRALWSHGTARFSVAEDLARGGMLQRSDGMLLGRIPVSLREAVRYLAWAPLGQSWCAIEMFLAAVRKKPLWVSTNRGVHTFVCAPAGRGKSTAFAIPLLLSCRDSMLVIDVKGELHTATADARRRMGQKVIVLDPYRQTAVTTSDTFSPFDLIDPAERDSLDAIRALAAEMVVRTGEEREPHWNDACEIFLSAVIALVSRFPSSERDLQSVANILANREELAKAIEAMTISDAWGGLLARLGHQLDHFQGEEFGSVMTTVARHLRFLSTPPIVASTAGSSFDPREFGRVPMTIYLVVPPDRLQTQNGLLRMWVGSFLRQVVKSGLTRDRTVRFLLDEAAALGRMESIENAITQLRGYGLKMIFMFQSLGQLRKVFSEGAEQTFLACMDVQVYFGVNDIQTADHVSQRLGEQTLRIVSANAGSSRNRNFDPHGMETGSSGTNTGWSNQEIGRRLLRPEEICQLHEQLAVVFAPGVAPLLVWLCRYFDPEFASRPRPSDRVPIWRCLGLGAASAVLAFVVTAALADRWQANRLRMPAGPVPKAPQQKQNPKQPYRTPQWVVTPDGRIVLVQP